MSCGSQEELDRTTFVGDDQVELLFLVVALAADMDVAQVSGRRHTDHLQVITVANGESYQAGKEAKYHGRESDH